ncbi:protein of unknown function [Methylorubrum extorquens]|uniref:Uncharacterized protein n=1 Tax=Methylorubrum extorquens TaxID=408 RepID=A0A2N9AWX8_METEX|nr:protein of unknown function [Methylorubrum extorquens]
MRDRGHAAWRRPLRVTGPKGFPGALLTAVPVIAASGPRALPHWTFIRPGFLNESRGDTQFLATDCGASPGPQHRKQIS